ncbi:MAG: hypothetical protein M3N98_02820 [Actinomycetota bacterium]|nr:hypothetical protein [Actinomycetota bacterium]
MGSLVHISLLAAAVTWDPFVRGGLILVLFVVLLPGSVLFVLSTNTGIRLGFLLGLAGLTGMMALLSLLWMPLASSADIGRPNSWHPLQVITGDFNGQVTIAGAKSFPANDVKSAKPPLKALPTKHWYWPLQSCSDSGWHKIDPSLLSDPGSRADQVLAAPPNLTGTATPPALTTPFSSNSDYVYIDGYTSGQNGGCLFAISRHKIYMPLARGAHYVILRVQPVLPTLSTGGAPPPAQADTSKPYTYVIMERNLGSVRQPQALLSFSSGLIFLVICYVLHTREKDQRAAEAGAATKPAEREKVGASA